MEPSTLSASIRKWRESISWILCSFDIILQLFFFVLEFDEPLGEESHSVRSVYIFVPHMHQLPSKFIIHTI